MATSKIGLGCWLGLITLLWALHPLLFSRARGILVLVTLTGALALVGWLIDMPFLVVWSGGLGLFTLTLTLMVTAQLPNFWIGLSAGIALLALLDGSQRFAYPQVMRSGRFDSIIVGSSTARLIDPEQLNGPFAARFANMARGFD